MIEMEQIFSLAKIHARPTGDPAISAEDVHQEIVLALLSKPAENFKYGWIRAKDTYRDLIRSKQCRRRRECSAIGEYDPPRFGDVLWEAFRGEIRDLADGLSAFQRSVVLRSLDGLTPQEIANEYGTSISSVSNAMKTAVNQLREACGLPALKTLRIGRSRRADEAESTPSRKVCVECGVPFDAKRADARICSNACRCRKSYRERRGNKD